MFNSNIKFSVKLKIYKTAICSLLTYGSEAWVLDEATQTMINGANVRCLSRFTGKDAHAEASTRTRTYDLVLENQRRRFRWLGHILRMGSERLVKLATQVQERRNSGGSMLMDVPHYINYTELTALAQKRKLWKQLAANIENKQTMYDCISDHYVTQQQT